MIQDVHERKIAIPVTTSGTGDSIIIPAQTDAWIYVHLLMGDLSNSGTMIVKAGSRSLAHMDLDQGQGYTSQDEPGEDNRPRFECKPGEAFIINVSAGTVFKGECHYSLRY